MKVSIIIPVYNAAQFLDKCIESALNQNQTGEVLVIDDRSTDNSLEICNDWVKKDSRVKVFQNEGIKGAGATRNVGLRNASCEYIAFLDADDYYLEGRFNEDEICFTTYSSILGIANNTKIITYNKARLNGLNSVFANGNLITSIELSNKIINFRNQSLTNSIHLNGLTIKIQRGKIWFDESLKQCQDVDFIFRILLVGRLLFTDLYIPKAVYNLHENNTISDYSEATFYRRKAAKKHFHLANLHMLSYQLRIKLFKDFVEYDYLWHFGKSGSFKKLKKLLLMPFFYYRIMSKTDPVYDKERKIHLS